jgi:uncharacterized damage-inducible protein DinB
MNLAERLTEEFTKETEATRRVFGRIPEARLSWAPHPKSLSLGQLALHIAATPGGVARLLQEPIREAPTILFPQPASLAEVFATLDASQETVPATLAGWGEAGLLAEWQMTRNGKTVFKVPRIEMVRSIMLNHSYHHRGELVVYLRLLDVPIPAIYGPSADENPFAG